MSKDIVKVVLVYNDENYSIEVQKYKKLKYIKEQVYKLFFSIKNDIDIKFNNKSLSSHLDLSIGMIFNEKSFVKLQIIPLQGVKKGIKLKLKNKNKEVNSENKEESKGKKDMFLTPNKQKKENIINASINIKSNNMNKSLEKIKAENKNKKKNEYLDLNLKKNGRIKLPPIKTEPNLKKIDIIPYNNCSECIKNKTSEYCRKCDKFLCFNCSNKNHSQEDHKLIDIDDNEKININRYKEEINKDLYDSFKYLNHINDDMLKDNSDIDKAKKNFEKIISSLVEIAAGIKDNLNEEIHFNVEENKDQVGIKINKIKDEINNENVKRNDIDVIKELNIKDKNINKLIKEYNCISKDEFVKNKIENLFLDIEDEIDKVIFELEEKIPDLTKTSYKF